MADIGEDDAVADGGDVVLPSLWGLYGGGWAQGYQNIYLEASEHGGAVHNYLPHSVHMIEYRE